jgi:hypothetical protein
VAATVDYKFSGPRTVILLYQIGFSTFTVLTYILLYKIGFSTFCMEHVHFTVLIFGEPKGQPRMARPVHLYTNRSWTICMSKNIFSKKFLYNPPLIAPNTVDRSNRAKFPITFLKLLYPPQVH